MNIEHLNYDDYIDTPSIPYQTDRDWECRRPNDIMSPCTFYMFERALFVGGKFAEEMEIIDKGGEFGVGALGNLERFFVVAGDIPNDQFSSVEWQEKRQDQFLSSFFSGMHADFQFPLIWYLECHYSDIEPSKLIFDDPMQKGVMPSDALFSDELKEVWEPYKLWLLDNAPLNVN